MSCDAEVDFTPLAITRAEGCGCVGAISADGRFVRPHPVSLADVDPVRGIYRYGVWYRAQLQPSAAADARPEDRDLTSDVQVLGEAPGASLWSWLTRVESPSVMQALAAGRSLGVVRARVERAYVTASVRGRRHLRLSFCDATSARYDWIIPEVIFCDLAWPHAQGTELELGWSRRLVDLLSTTETYLTLGLTKPNQRFPGKFGGCHPLVVGLHARLPYAGLLAAGPESLRPVLSRAEVG